MAGRGQKPGQGGAALEWSVYLDGLAEEHGSLAAVATRLSELRAFRDDVESVVRALRRLRGRGTLPGGTWGERLLGAFGLPRSVDDRLRFMGSYHSRFVDLPVPLCADLVSLWDRPPTSESRAGRTWLSLARASLALRRQHAADAAVHLETADAASDDDPRRRAEIILGKSLLDGKAPPPLFEPLTGPDGECLRARHAGQVAHAMNHTGNFAGGLAVHQKLPDGPEVAPFARSRRANGIAFGLYKLGEVDLALVQARLAAIFAGDAGHVRLRAMALLMVARIAGDTPEGRDARVRAHAIAVALEDETLLSRAAR